MKSLSELSDNELHRVKTTANLIINQTGLIITLLNTFEVKAVNEIKGGIEGNAQQLLIELEAEEKRRADLL